MTQYQSLVLKTSIFGGILGIIGAILVKYHRSTLVTDEPLSDDIETALFNEQENMRIKREDRRQLPVLTSWEKEL